MCVCITMYRGQVRGERRGEEGRLGNNRERKLPGTMKSMVMKLNTS